MLPSPVIVSSSVVTAAGLGRGALVEALLAQRSALRPNRVSSQPLATLVGEVEGLDAVRLPPALQALDCRNHRLAWLGLQVDGFAARVQRVRDQAGAARIGVVMGTSTSSIAASEAAYRQLDANGQTPANLRQPELHSLHSLGSFVARALALQGPSMTVSTACSSSAKAFAVAQRWLALGWVDAVVVGGADSLCDSVLFGFSALQLVSPRGCQPFDAQRQGISLGEAAGFALVMREADAHRFGLPPQARLRGVGESSDAHHMTAPQPQGQAIEIAVRQALHHAGLQPADIDYINLHGTATPKNDEAEAAMVARVFPAGVHASSTKGCTGHTLGASGIVEAVVCLLAMERGFKPGCVNSTVLDAACGPQIQLQGRHAPVRRAVSHAFGFGGTNAVLVLEAVA